MKNRPYGKGGGTAKGVRPKVAQNKTGGAAARLQKKKKKEREEG